MNIKLPNFLKQPRKGSNKSSGRITGLDIGNFQVKVLQTDYENGAIKALRFGNGKTVQEAVQSFPEPPKIANISVSGQSVITRYIELPKMSQEETTSALQFEAEKHIPIPIDQVILDFHILEELKDNKQRVLLAACKKELIDNRIELLKNLNIAINIIDIDSLALANSFLHTNAETAQDAICALVNIGAKFTNLHILDKNSSYLIRDIPVAGDEINRIISERLAIALEEAEGLKCNIPDGKENEIADAIRPAIENIAGELQMSFDYLDNSYGKTVDKIFISGGCANLKGLDEMLKECINIDVSMWSPLGYEGFTDKPEFTIASGLCLRR